MERLHIESNRVQTWLVALPRLRDGRHQHRLRRRNGQKRFLR
jgi:hypothetical protein